MIKNYYSNQKIFENLTNEAKKELKYYERRFYFRIHKNRFNKDINEMNVFPWVFWKIIIFRIWIKFSSNIKLRSQSIISEISKENLSENSDCNVICNSDFENDDFF